MTGLPRRYQTLPFDENTTSPQRIIAQAYARGAGETVIRPELWWVAAQAVRELRAKRLLNERGLPRYGNHGGHADA